jgi:hypothetical protein
VIAIGGREPTTFPARSTVMNVKTKIQAGFDLEDYAGTY